MSLDIALSGIHAINAQLDAISNNIANSSTYGFKSSRANFSALYAGEAATGAALSSMTQSIALGGNTSTTGGAMDVAISGRGFFVTHDAGGAEVYSRVGLFSVNKDGYVVDGSSRKAQGYASIAGSTALGAMGDMKVPTGQIAAKPTDGLNYVGNLSADWTTPSVATFDPADPQSFNSSVVSVVYDSLGAQHSLTQYFVKSGTNQVTANYTLDGAAAGSPTVMSFDTGGQLSSPTTVVTLSLGTPAAAAPLSVAVDYAGTTQFAGEATTVTNSASGYASGALNGVKIDATGAVIATYSNGQKQSIGTLAIAAFPDEGKLTAVGDTSWTTSSGSGTPVYATPGSSGAGSLTTGSLEQSNVDITSELVNLMTSQRNYQANSKVISTEATMLQALMQAV